MRTIDISIPLNESTPSFTGRPVMHRSRLASIDADGYEEHDLFLTTHSGTHLDAQRHFVPGGMALSDLPIERFVTTAHVVDVTGHDAIGVREVELPGVQPGHSLLFKTGNPACGLTVEAAEWVVAHGVQLVGIDHASIEVGDPRFPVHGILLGAGVLILEFLRLNHVEPGVYTLASLPLAVTDTDGAPTRAVLMRFDQAPA